MMLLMVCLVFASAGPAVPSVGDVFSMGPTMAYGADPHMLHSAPDWGSGFVFGGRSFTLNFLSPLNASIAGQTCTPGAQEVIAHVPKWPMAGRPSSGARTEGISKVFCPTGKKLVFFFFIFGRGRPIGAARAVCAHSWPQQSTRSGSVRER